VAQAKVKSNTNPVCAIYKYTAYSMHVNTTIFHGSSQQPTAATTKTHLLARERSDAATQQQTTTANSKYQ
jgi:hypothetical protein